MYLHSIFPYRLFKCYIWKGFSTVFSAVSGQGKCLGKIKIRNKSTIGIYINQHLQENLFISPVLSARTYITTLFENTSALTFFIIISSWPQI